MAVIYTAKYMLPGNAPLIVGGALLDVDGRIAEVGTLSEVCRGNEQVRVVDFADTILLPSLVNAHTHLELTDYPRWSAQCGETAAPSNFVDWILQVIRVKHTVPHESYLPSIMHGITLSLSAGTGAVGDILSRFPVRNAYQESPLRGMIYLESLGQDDDFIRKSLQAVESALKDKNIGRTQLGLSPHSPYTISAEYLKTLYEKCHDEGLLCATHVAESADEVEFLRSERGEIGETLYPYVGWQDKLGNPPGLSPVDYLQRQGGLSANNLLVHGVQLSEAEISKVATAGCFLALCPRSNARLDVGVAPVRQLLAAGVGLALGTDSLASCDSLSIWDEIAFARDWFAGQVDAPSLLQMATAAGAEALGLGAELGRLQSGYRSSFQVLHPEVLPAEDEVLDFLVAPGRSKEIEQLYLDGVSVLSGSD